LLNQAATSSNYSRALGIDGLWNVTPAIRLDASLARSFAPEVPESELAGDFGFILNKKWIDINLRYTYIDSLFNPRMSFVLRPNIRNTDGNVTFTKWINGKYLQTVAFSSGLLYITDHHQILQTRELPIASIITFSKGDALELEAARAYEFVPYDSYIRNIKIDAGEYTTWAQSVNFTSYRARPVNGTVSLQWGELFNGSQFGANVSGTAKASNHLSIDMTYSYNNLDLKNGHLRAHVLSTRWTWSFTPDFFAKAYLQWNSADERFSGNFIIDYAYRPRSHVYLVYNENQDTLKRQPTDRIIMLKLTYLWQI